MDFLFLDFVFLAPHPDMGKKVCYHLFALQQHMKDQSYIVISIVRICNKNLPPKDYNLDLSKE